MQRKSVFLRISLETKVFQKKITDHAVVLFCANTFGIALSFPSNKVNQKILIFRKNNFWRIKAKKGEEFFWFN